MHGRTTAILAAAALACAFNAPAQTEAGSDGFRTFNLILQRNIFDPNRQPYIQESDRREVVKPPRVDRLALVGVFLDRDEKIALFSGTQDSFNMRLQPGDMVAGFRIGTITTEALTMTKEEGESTKEFELRVGTGFRRVEDGPWELSNEPPPEAPPEAASSDGVSTPTDADRAAKLKELMERRLKGSSK